MDGQRIQSVFTRNMQTNIEMEYKGQIFIDCSGRAILGVYSGASTMFGQESKQDFNENLAPLQADNMHHGNTVLFRTELQDEPVSFPDVPWAQRVAKDFSDLGGSNQTSDLFKWKRPL